MDIEHCKELHMKGELGVRRQRLWKEKPLWTFFVLKSKGLSTVFFAGIWVGSVFSNYLGILSFFLMFFFIYVGTKVLPKWEQLTPWKRAPFADFSQEYPGDIAQRLDCCSKSDCESVLVVLTVEYFDVPSLPSPYRFLWASSPDGTEKYCVDIWKKQGPIIVDWSNRVSDRQ